MDEYHQITLDEWTSWKEDIRNKLAETAQNFVYIGYRLKQIRDSGMFGGAEDVFEFAQKEYGLGKSTVSRFIAINEKYSKGGNSLELEEKYQGFSSSKLSEMLTLPDSECEMITEKTTVKEIRELKNFTKQDPDKVEAHPEELTPLQACIIDYFKDKKDMLNKVFELAEDTKDKEAAEAMNPSGSASHTKGICFMFMYDYNTGIKYRLLTDQEPKSMTWSDFLDTVSDIYLNGHEEGNKDVWSEYYKAVATSQQKTSEVEAPKTEESQPAAVIEEKKEAESQEPTEPEQIVENENTENKEISEPQESEKPASEMAELVSEKEEEKEEPIKTEEEKTESSQTQETTEPEAVATSQQKKDDGEHSDDRFERRGQLLERLEKLQKAINLQEWDYALDINKHLGWDIEWMINN